MSIETFSSNITDALSSMGIVFIILILTLKTIFDILYVTGLHKGLYKLFPSEKTLKFQNFIESLYSFFSEQTAEIVIKRLKEDQDIEIKKRENIQYQCISPLVDLLAKHTFHFSNGIYYGNDRTNYYINTLGASLHKRDLEIMSEYIIRLIRKFNSEGIDFVVSPKTGNVLLGYTVAKKLNTLFLIVKSEEERSRVTNNKESHTDLNIEGASLLKERLNKMSQNKILKGIVIDCNFSGGTQLLICFKEINSLFSKRVSLNEAYTLFKVDDSEIKPELKNYTIHRYFDLDEQAKKILYGIKSNTIENGKAYQIPDFIDYLRKKGKLPEEKLSIYSC